MTTSARLVFPFVVLAVLLTVACAIFYPGAFADENGAQALSAQLARDRANL